MKKWVLIFLSIVMMLVLAVPALAGTGTAEAAQGVGHAAYTVEFTYDGRQYVMPGDSSVRLSAILDEIGLTGAVEAAEVSDASLFSASNETGEWVVTAHRAFSSAEWMKVTIDGVAYEITVTDDASDEWAALQNAITNATGENPTIDVSAYAGADGRIKCPAGGSALQINKKITLDLKGCVIDRGLTAEADDGYVIEVGASGDLTVTDGAPNAAHDPAITYTDPIENQSITVTGGVITGGYNTGDGGGVYVNSNGTFTLSGGTISGNHSYYGGGVYNIGTFNVSGGAISLNHSTYGGGVENDGTFTMTGGAISGNHSGFYGGGVNNYGTFTMEDGAISGNHSGTYGGGVLNAGTFTMTGGEISGNHSDSYGGGVDNAGTFNVSGGARVTGNLVGEAASNVYLPDGKTITVTDALVNTAIIGVNTEASPASASVVITSGLSGKGALTSFTSDDALFTVVESGGEAALISEWAALQNAIDATGENPTIDVSAYAGADGRIKCPAGGSALQIDRKITLDLKGCVIDRGLTAATNGGYVIYVGASGDLTVTDTAPNAEHDPAITYTDPIANQSVTVTGGVITGGYNTNDGFGGGVYVNSNGTFTLSGGTISGNHSDSSGGGVYNYGTFTLSGGAISGNHSVDYGGGVDNDGTFTMTGGAISGNHSDVGGGVDNYGTFTLSGGAISGNSASIYGGGVYVNSNGTFTLSGGAISGNSASGYGGGVYNYGTFNVSGGARVTDNVVDTADSNVYLPNNKVITVAGALDNTAKIGVTTEASPGDGSVAITSGLGSYGRLANFTSDNAAYDVGVVNGEAALGVAHGVTVEETTNGSVSADKTTAIPGEVVTLTATPAAEYMLNTLTVKQGDADVPVTGNTFTMPAGDVTVSATFITEWDALQAAINAATGDDPTIDVSAYAGDDKTITCPADGGALSINKKITLDLNGCVIDRGLTAEADDGYVIHVGASGDLTVTDGAPNAEHTPAITYEDPIANQSVTVKGGVITGGYNTGNGGGVYVNRNGKFTLSGGAISGNTTEYYGGGVVNLGTFTLSGGTISGNHSGYHGGGVYNNYGTFTLSGGTISGNHSRYGGGVYNSGTGTFTLSGGEISGNHSGHDGGGVYVDSYGTFNVSGGAISGNSASGNGGGVYVNINGTFKVSGGAKVTGNMKGTAASNVYLTNNKVITVDGALTDDALFGVRTQASPEDGNVPITSGLSTFGTAANFASDNAAYAVGVVNGEAVLGVAHSVTITTTGTGAIEADKASGQYLQGETVTLTVTEEKGHPLTALSAARDDDQTEVTPTAGEDGTFTFAMPAGGVTVTATFTNEWAALQAAINGAGDDPVVVSACDANGDGIITCPADGSGLQINKKITLDLNGCVINRALTAATNGGYVIRVGASGDLTVTDSASTAEHTPAITYTNPITNGPVTVNGGVITGGNDNGNGGGVVVNSNGKFTLSGGTVCGNHSDVGGGVYNDGTFTLSGGEISGNHSDFGGGVTNYGTFNVSGGAISGNHSNYYGGGVTNAGTFTLSGGEISGNHSDSYGGGVYVNINGTFTLSGGEISGNSSEFVGGGVYNYGTFTLSGGEISGNSASNNGGGVYSNGTFNVSGGAQVTGNLKGTAASNVYLTDGRTITVTGTLDDDALFGVTTEMSPGNGIVPITDGLSTNGTAANFTSDNSAYAVGVVNGEAALGVAHGVTVDPTPTNGTVTADKATAIPGETVKLTVEPAAEHMLDTLSVKQGDADVSVTDDTFTMPAGDVTVSAAFITEWDALQAAINSATGDSPTVDVSAYAGADGRIKCPEGGSYLYINKKITLDLKGCVIDRGLTTATTGGYVIRVDESGDLTVTDSASNTEHTPAIAYTDPIANQSVTVTGGVITGGYNFDDGSSSSSDGGGGVCVSGGVFTLSGGTICLNRSKYFGSGVCVNGKGTFTMTGGAISGNSGTYAGGGVYVKSNGTFTLSGGEISGNHSDFGGGVYNYGTFTLSGGEISDNSASSNGGGVYNAGTFTLSGGAISGNISVRDGGGVYSSGTFNVSGGARVTDNLKGTAANNVYLTNSKVITVDGALDNTAIIGVTTQAKPASAIVAITSGLSTYGTAAHFASDKSAYAVGVVSGEAALGVAHGVTVEETTNGSVSADKTTAIPGEVVTLTPAPAAEYMLNTLTVKQGETPVSVTDNTFTMPAGDVTVSAAFITEWDALQAAIDAATGTDPTVVVSDYAGEDKTITCPADGSALQINKEITLDLNGCVIDRALTAATNDGYVIYVGVSGDLTVTDTASDAEHDPAITYEDPIMHQSVTVTGGVITGGCNTGIGGGVFVNRNGTFTLSGGAISGNHSGNGGGVYNNYGTFTLSGGAISGNHSDVGGGVSNSGTFTLSGGAISGNHSGNGGGVYNYGTFTLSGGAISGNHSNYGGGVFNAVNSTFTLSDGAISDNSASSNGGGVYNAVNSTFTLSGGEISGNISGDNGGGVYVNINGTFKVSGDARVTGNLKGTAASNVYLTNNRKITVDGALTDDAAFGVTTQASPYDGNVPITSGLSTFGAAAHFASDDAACAVAVLDGEAVLGVAHSVTITATGTGAIEADKASGKYLQGETVTLTVTEVKGHPLTLSVTQGETPLTPTEGANNTRSFAMPAGDVTVTATFTNEWAALQAAITNAGDDPVDVSACDANGDKIITCPADDSALQINKEITLDLNGCVIDRGLIAKADDGYVIEVGASGDLTVTDSASDAEHDPAITYIDPISNQSVTVKGGVITGGYSSNGGGVYVNSNGKFTLSGGTISGNSTSANGGGVYVNSNGKFTLSGGAISGNRSDHNGGGVYNNYGTFTLSGGAICGNHSGNGGGVYNNYGTFTQSGGTLCGNHSDYYGGGVSNYGTFTLSGGAISGNSASSSGGGVRNAGTGTFNVSGGEISGNSTSGIGGGVYVDSYGTFNVSGDAQVTGNLRGEAADNVYLTNSKVITVDGALTDDAKISVTTAASPGNASVAITSGLGSYGTAASFASDNAAYAVGVVNGEAALGVAHSVTVDPTPTNGAVTVDKATAIPGETVKLTVAPAEGYALSSLTYTYPPDGGTATTANVYADESGAFSFAMPAADVAVKAAFMTPWAALQQRFSDASGDKDHPTLITLTEDVTASDADNALELPADRYVALDLNGFTVDRALTDSVDNGYVIGVNGTLTVTDGSANHGGQITGGKNTGSGGGVYVVVGGTFTLSGGTITANSAYYNGGGVYVYGSNSSFTLSGGAVSGNSADASGGGVYVDGGSFTLSGSGAVSGNSVSSSGGGVYVYSGTFNMQGGALSGNSAEYSGGGVYVEGGAFTLSGSPVIQDNTKGTGQSATANNVYLYTDKTITVGDTLSNTQKIGVTMKNPGTFTSGLSGRLPEGKTVNDLFASEDAEHYAVRLTADGEAALRKRSAVTWTAPENGGITISVGGSAVDSGVIVAAGDAITLTATPAAGYALNTLTYTPEGGAATDVAAEKTFAMTDQSVTVAAAFTPIIQTQPSDLTLTYGYTEGAVTVVANSLDGHSLSYQWYACDDASGTNPQAIGGATAASYTVPTGKRAGTKEYCYCVVTDTRTANSEAASATSGVATVTVEKASVYITGLSAQNKSYDGDVAATVTGTAAIEGKVEGDDVSVSAGSASFADANVGTGKTVTFSGYSLTGDKAGNYVLSVQPVSVTADITARPVTITAASESWTYDGNAHSSNTVTVTSGSLLTDDELVATATGSVTNVADTVEGNNPVAAGYKVMHGTEDVTKNYAITTQAGTLTVTPKTVTVTAKDKAFTYTGEVQSWNQYDMDGLVGDDAISAVVTGSITFPSQSPVTNTLTSYEFTTGTPGNYSVTTADGQLTMTNASVAITITAASESWTYDCNAHSNNTVTLTSGSLLTGDSLVATASGSVTNVADTVAGNNPIAAGYKIMHGTEDVTANYAITTQAGTLTINPKPVTITGVTATSRDYNGEKTVALSGGTVNDVENSDTVTADLSAATGTMADANVGENKAVTVNGAALSGMDAGNYALSAQPTGVTANITVKPVTVSGIAASNKTYDGKTDATLSYTGVSFGGIVSGDVLTVSTSGAFADAGASDDVKTVSISDLTLGGTSVGNYVLATSGQQTTTTAKISKAPLTVTANPKTITYGEAPANDGVVYSGFVNSETESVLTGTLAYAYSYEQYGNVGSNYTITPRGLTSDNYEISFAAGTLTVEQKTLGLDWSTTPLTYTGSAQAPTATATGTVNGDTVSVTVTGAQTDAGTDYTATASALTGDKAGNYKLPNVKTTNFSIGKAAARNIADVTQTLVYTAKSVSASLAEVMPANAGTLSYTAGTASTTGSVTVSSFAVNSQGSVTATISGGAVGNTITLPVTISSTNYADSTVNVVITLTDKGTQTIAANDVTATYGDTDKSVSASVTDPAMGGGAISYAVKTGSENYIGVAADGALTINAVPPTDGRAYVIVTAAETADYAEATKEVTVTISKANAVPAAVTANNRTYDGTEKPLVTITGETTGGTLKLAVTTENKEPGADAYTFDTTSIPTKTDAGTYYVWYKAVGDANHNDSAAACVTARILAPVSATVTFRVVGGAWDDGTAEAKTVTLTGHEGDTLKLAAADIPAVGGKPGATYKAGAWDTVPSAETAITGDTTYTYTYAKKDAISATVTFRVVGGAWDDGTTGDKVVTLTGCEGDALKLAAADIPAVGNKPADGCKAGAWDVTPNTETAITGDTTYTYTYAEKAAISATVTFRVVGGSWDDGTIENKTVSLTGYEGDILKLAAADIPAVGNRPADTYKAGAWDVTPSADTAIIGDTTYTYTYAKKDAISATVTFRVVGGAWDDGTAEAKTVTLTGHEGDVLKLAAADIPAVGNRPADGCKAGAWDVTPSADTAIIRDTTYTYAYAKKAAISATVTFKVVGGAWDDGTTENKTVSLTGYEGDALKLAAADIPAVGNRPSEGCKAGAWDTTPSTETAITGDMTYTYTYEKEAPAATPAEVTKAPKAKKLTYSGKAQKLVTAGEAEGGAMVYAVTKSNKAPKASAYKQSIPAGTDAGTYYVWYRAAGDADHTDSEPASVKARIKPADIGKCRITVKDLTWTGEVLVPIVTVRHGKKKLAENADYTLAYSKKVMDVGAYAVKVKGKGNYAGAEKLKFKVNPKGTALTKAKGGPQQIVLKWKRQEGVAGYQIQYSLKKGFSTKKTVKIEDAGTVTQKITGLKAGKTYYLRIRTWKDVGEETYVSGWSGTSRVKTEAAEAETRVVRVEMRVGDKLNLKKHLTKAEAKSVKKWSTADKKIARVSKKGVVTARKKGDVVITATCADGNKVEFEISVSEKEIFLITNEACDEIPDAAAGSSDTEMVFELE